MKQELPYDLTVITVCRNALGLLPRCIASVQPVHRTPLRVEHLVIDGASTDGTAEYLAHAQRCGLITRYVSEPDRGIYDAMNKGICLARGKVIVFINADDEIVADAVEGCCAPLLAGRAGYTVASAWCLEGRQRRLLRPRMNAVLWRQPYCHQAMYSLRELLMRFDGFAGERFPIGADTELMRRLYVAGVSYAVVPVVAARFYAGGISFSPETNREVYELMLKFAGACCAEVRRRPGMSGVVLKHLRRYANKHLQLALAENGYAAEAERLVAFVRALVQELSPGRRLALQCRLRLQGCWYGMRARCVRGRRQEAARLNHGICKLIANTI